MMKIINILIKVRDLHTIYRIMYDKLALRNILTVDFGKIAIILCIPLTP